MTRIVRAREESESGVILIIFAAAMVVLLGMMAIAIDGSYGFVQNRRAQNATDFAAFAAAQELNNSTYCNGAATPSMQDITQVIQHIINDNDAGVGTAWTAQFLNTNGHAIGSTFTPQDYATEQPPPGACGVSVSAAPTWKPFFAGIFGIHQLQGYATGSVANTAKGTPIGIVALNQVGPHEILGGGNGSFVVSGDIFLNTDVTNQPWTGSSGGYEWDDAIDAKTSSNLFVYGTIHTIDGTYNNKPLWPLDTCFEGAGILGQGNPSSPTPAYQIGDPAAQKPAVHPACTEGAVTLYYDNIDNSVAQITDPLATVGAPASPLADNTNIACPGMSTRVYGAIPPTTSVLRPGEYTSPVELTGSVNFDDCSGYSGEAAYPGIYRFDDGLWINPQSAGDTVTGSNVVIGTQAPYPMAGNVPGTLTNGVFSAPPGAAGNGAPCLPAGTLTSAASGRGTPEPETTSSQCAGTSPATYGVVAYHDKPIAVDNSMSGTGNNFSLIVGGVSGATVSLTGPTTGAYGGIGDTPGMVFYQDPQTQANYGFDAEAGDAAAITVTGVVYNASLSSYGAAAPQDYWDGIGGGIPFYAGGTLQTGYGAGWGATGPPASAGSVTINGTSIVDDFNTDGATTITILGQPYTLPGGSQLSLIG